MHRALILSMAALTGFAVIGQAQSGKQAVHAQLLQELKSAHHLLAEANHDYHGHRAKAAEEVHKALKELGHQHKSNTPRAAPKTASKEDQALSDSQLRQAQKILTSALTQLNTRHPRAHANVQAAIGEINQAFASRQGSPKK